ncbi:MAG TPA: polyprenol phosphomannose-dependent alpha 1,6 mannosyltransferase MptB, partial [Candidatus Limnocylindria bacterium]|nr:polyprenol phosphomannose-dependent alpha 1,6 mannosyltransferase MptB [Candidatus Limnocylindria bacterium]
MVIIDRVGAALRAKVPAADVTPRTDGRPTESSSSLVAEFAISGFLGSALMGIGALSVGFAAPSSGIPTAPVLETLRLTAGWAVLGWITVVLGVAVLLQAWLRLGHHVRTASVVNPHQLLRLMWLWALPLFLTPVMFSRDIFSYISASRMLSAGLDPYTNGTIDLPWTNDGADAFWVGSPSPYGPLWVGLSSGVFHITGASAIPSLLAFRLLALAGVALLAVYLPRLAALCGVDAAKVIWLGLLNPLVLMHFVSAGHNDALMLGLLVAGMTIALEGKFVIGTLLVVLAGAIKAPALLGLPFVAMAWPGADASLGGRVWSWVKVTVLALIAFVALNLAIGLDFGWISALSTPGEVRTWLSPVTALGMIGGILGELLGSANFDDGSVAVLRALGAAVALTVVALLAFVCDRRTAPRALGLALLVVVVLGATVQPWYLMWSLLILVAAGLSANETRVAVILS